LALSLDGEARGHFYPRAARQKNHLEIRVQAQEAGAAMPRHYAWIDAWIDFLKLL